MTVSNRTLYEWFGSSVRRFPHEPALEVQGVSLTYQELARCADVLATWIWHAHGRAPRRVALLAARSPVAYAGYLAALRLGATVTPLNPGYPATRNHSVCRLAGVEVLLVDESGAAQLDVVSSDIGATVLVLSDEEVTAAGAAFDLPPYETTPDDIAYILFTSGSTGRPKGVPIRHRNLAPYIAHNIDRFEVGPGSRTSHTFDLTFDPSVFDLFVTWGGGGTLVVPQRTELLKPVDYVVDHEITHWYSVPSVVSVSAQLGNLPAGRVSTLRYSIFIGEQLTYAQCQGWRDVAPGSVIENVYGPTELTVACSEYRLPADRDEWPATSNDTVPIGPVYGFLDYVVIDEQGLPADEGELCVRGPQRFDGYLDPADDVGRFILPGGPGDAVYDGSSPLTPAHYYRTGDRVRIEHGNWVHLGRLDNQVKIRGYRVELGEIEAALRRHPVVTNAVVVTSPRASETELVAFYTGSALRPSDLLHWLRKHVPIHMVPRRFEHLPQLPLNANGKIDRGQLRARLTGEPVVA